jgi:hypothetical protein
MLVEELQNVLYERLVAYRFCRGTLQNGRRFMF